MQKSKFIFGMLAVTLVLEAYPFQALARTKGGTLVNNTSVGVLPIAQSPGRYEFVQMNESAVYQQYLGIIQKLRDDDRALVLQTIRNMDVAVSEFIQQTVKDGLRKLSDDSMASGSVAPLKPSQFLAARREFMAQKEQIINKVKTIEQIPATLKNQDGIRVNGQQLQVQGSILDFSKLSAFYISQIEKMSSGLDDLQFRIKNEDANIDLIQKGITVVREELKNPYTPSQLAEIRKRIVLNKQPSPQERQMLNSTINAYMRSQIIAINDTFGKNSKLRATYQVVEESEKTQLGSLEDLFYARSVLRAYHGIRLGALVVGNSAGMQTMNWDFFTRGPLQFATSEFVFTDADMTRSIRELGEAMTVHKMRTEDVFGANATNIFGRLASAVTFLKGEKRWETINALELNLLKQDMDEEILVGQPGGLRGLKEKIQARFYNTEERKTHFQALKGQIAGLLGSQSSGAAQQSDAWGDVGSTEQGSLIGAISAGHQALAMVRDRMNSLRSLESTIAEIESLNTLKKNGDSRLNDI